jgi:2-dehydro-3-deoxyphosphogluconate aldolase/(4S)-4-hydroxy-2-oxoglutarate aldolase
MNRLFNDNLLGQIRESGVIAVLVVDKLEDSVPLARALLEGGIQTMELTLRTPVALEALKRIRAEVPEMVAGIGTILTPEQARQAKEAGAAFGVAPGMNPRVVSAALKLSLPFAPGVATPSDIEQALEFGCRLLKFFPAEGCGGLTYLRNMAAPYMHLGLRYIPLGGLNTGNLEAYAKEPLVHALGGSWIAPRELILKQDWDAIRSNARDAKQAIEKIHKGVRV